MGVRLRFRRPRDWSIVEMEGVVERVLQHTDGIPGTRTETPRVRIAFDGPLDLAEPIAS